MTDTDRMRQRYELRMRRMDYITRAVHHFGRAEGLCEYQVFVMNRLAHNLFECVMSVGRVLALVMGMVRTGGNSNGSNAEAEAARVDVPGDWQGA